MSSIQQIPFEVNEYIDYHDKSVNELYEKAKANGDEATMSWCLMYFKQRAKIESLRIPKFIIYD